MNYTTTALNGLIDFAEGGPLEYFLAVAALGVLTMSLLQAAKNLFPLRRAYHKYVLRNWLRRHPCPCKAEHENLQKVLLELAADGNEQALYEAETEEFCKNLAAVGQLAVDFPGHDDLGDLLKVMTSRRVYADIEVLRDPKTTAEERLDARDRVRQHLAQSLNAFRLSTAASWQWIMHIAAFVISFVLACAAVVVSEKVSLSVAFTSSLLAAFLAPVARDIAAGIQKLRT